MFPRSIDRAIIACEGVSVASTLELMFIVSRIEISVDFLVTWVGFSVPPIRCIVVKVSGLFETFTVGFMPLIWMTIIDEMSSFIIVVL